VIKLHHGEKKDVRLFKLHEKLHLSNAVFVSEGRGLHLGLHQHHWDDVGGNTDVHKGQVRGEELHGCVQVRD
jgi:hypothetical protein